MKVRCVKWQKTIGNWQIAENNLYRELSGTFGTEIEQHRVTAEVG